MATHPLLNFDEGMTSHFAELRNRLFICISVAVVGMLIGWFIYPYVYQAIAGPVIKGMKLLGGKVIMLDPMEAFLTQMKLAAWSGVVLASPLIIWQIWAFIRPGLTIRERRAVAPIVPAISALFALGALIAYLLLPRVINFLLSFVPRNVEANIGFQHTINLPLGLMFAFGLAFQLPVLLLGLVALHILTPRVLLANWRIAVLAMTILAAAITPTPDPLSMLLLMVPLILLYFATVLFAFRVQRVMEKPEEKP